MVMECQTPFVHRFVEMDIEYMMDLRPATQVGFILHYIKCKIQRMDATTPVKLILDLDVEKTFFQDHFAIHSVEMESLINRLNNVMIKMILMEMVVALLVKLRINGCALIKRTKSQ